MPQPSFAEVAAQYPLRSILRKYGIKIKSGGNFLCPFHDDKDPSAHIFTADNGVEMAQCQSDRCRKLFDSIELTAHKENTDHNGAIRILTQGKITPMEKPERKPVSLEWHLGPIPADRFPIAAGKVFNYLNKDARQKQVTPSAVHVYRNANGTPVGLVLRGKRFDGDKFTFPMRWDTLRNAFVGKGWTEKDRPPLYGADQLAAHPDRPVLVVEGEKCVDLAQAILDDWVVVSWQGGTAQLAKTDWSPLNGREVTFWPDADLPKDGQVDGPGEKAMRQIASLCKPRPAWWIEPLNEWRDHPSIKGFDVADLITESGPGAAPIVRATITDLRSEIRQDVVPVGPSSRNVEDWLPQGIRLETNADGGVARKSETNAWLILEHHPEFKGRFQWDVFTRDVLIDGQPITDIRGRHLVVELSNKTGIQIKFETLMGMVVQLAMASEINPMGDYLRQLATTWDGKQRRLLEYAGVEDSDWSRVVSRRWGLGLVRRIMMPGYKHDGVLVLEGEEGLGKSTFVAKFAELKGQSLHLSLTDLRVKDNDAMRLAGKAVVELAEMAAHRKSDADAFKALITATRDNYRPPYGKRFIDVDRVCVFAATTNNTKSYLTDPTGNRRIWPVLVTKRVDFDRLERDREQIWAELAHRALLTGDKFDQNWLLPNEENIQKKQAGERTLVDGWLDPLEALTDGKDKVTNHEVWVACGHESTKDRANNASKRISDIMVSLGFEPFRAPRGSDGKRGPWGWRRT